MFINVSMRILAVNEWSRLPNSSLLAVIECFKIEKFLRFLSVSSISSLNISAVYMWAPYKRKWLLINGSV